MVPSNLPASGFDGAAPFVVAVSGHRALHAGDREALGAQLFGTLRLIAATLPDSPLDFLSPLADGADQLFAEQVLRLRDSLPHALRARVRLLVPLPMPFDDYCAAQGGADQAGFRQRIAPYLAQADSVYQVAEAGIGDCAGLTAENRPYAKLGRYLAIHSHLLLALWDGDAQEASPGGTAAVVDAVLQGRARCRMADGRDLLEEPDDGYVLHLCVRRAGSGEAGMVAPALHGLGRGGEIAPADCIAQAGRDLDALNRRHRRLAAADGDYADRIAAGAAAVLGELGAADHGVLAPLARAFAIADVQAGHAKRIWRRSWLAIALAAVLAGSSSLLRLLNEEHGELIETLSFGAGAVIAIGIYLWVARAGERNAYLAYRALAEGVRVQLAWLAAGSDALASDCFLRKQRGEIGWVRKCIDGLTLHGADAAAAVAPATVLRGWIGGQQAYLEGPHQARRRREQLRSARWGHRLLLCGLACAVLGVVLSAHHGTVSSWTMLLLIIAMKLSTDLGAAWVSFDGKMAHAETLQQMAHLRAVYARAAHALEKIGDDQQAAMALLLALGREVLEEEGNWVRVYMERRLAWHGR